MNRMGNQLLAYALFVLYGKEVSLQLDGTIEIQRGYIRLKPTAGKPGSLPIPSSTLNNVVHQLFASPQKRNNSSSRPRLNPSGSRTTPLSSPHDSGRSSASFVLARIEKPVALLEQACESCYLPCPVETRLVTCEARI